MGSHRAAKPDDHHQPQPFRSLTCQGEAGTKPYYIRSAFNGGLTFGDDTRKPNYPKEELKKGLAECKRMRRYILGDFYALFHPGPAPDAWCAWQYDLTTEGAGAIFVFRRSASPYSAMQARPKGIAPAASYAVTLYETYDPQPEIKMSGQELMDYSVVINEAPGSVLMEYRKR